MKPAAALVHKAPTFSSPCVAAKPRHRGRVVTSSCLTCMRTKRAPIRVAPSKVKVEEEEEAAVEHGQPAGVRVALSMLRFYKTAISPILPPSCRFVPTCSTYAMEAYSEYGVGKGTIMTAWRLMRCTPWGDSGYDPAVWPPKGLGWMSSFLQ